MWRLLTFCVFWDNKQYLLDPVCIYRARKLCFSFFILNVFLPQVVRNLQGSCVKFLYTFQTTWHFEKKKSFFNVNHSISNLQHLQCILQVYVTLTQFRNENGRDYSVLGAFSMNTVRQLQTEK